MPLLFALSWQPMPIQHPRRAIPPRLLASTATAELWLESVYDSIDYETVLFAEEEQDEESDEQDFSADEFIYGESSLHFFMQVLRAALDIIEPNCGDSSGFCDLGGGKGQLALAAAREEPERLDGAVCSVELMPELHLMANAAFAIAADGDPAFRRVTATRGSIYDTATLNDACGGAAAVYAYATKFESTDGEHVERLSAALASCALPAEAIVITVNRKLVEKDGWVEAARPIEGEVPHETSGRGTAFFWRRRRV